MGYGHVRAASAVAELFDTQVRLCDRPPLASPAEVRTWERSRSFYEWCTRNSTLPVVGAPLRPVVRWLTALPALEGDADLRPAPWIVRRLAHSIDKGLGAELVRRLREQPQPLLATYFAPALAADAAGLDGIWLVVTDSEVHRVWAPVDAARTRIRYAVATPRTRSRLVAYGVPPERICVTGFPLPGELVGEDDRARRTNLAGRLARLAQTGAGQASPVQVTFAIGGAGAQVPLALQVLRTLDPLLRRGTVRLALVAGVRPKVRRSLERALAGARLPAAGTCPVEILYRETLSEYLSAFHALLARTDLLWTKPSELTFFGALGLPLVLAPPVGVHEAYNAAYARQCGVGIDPPAMSQVVRWLTAGLKDGTFARAAQAGFDGLPAAGAYRIRDAVGVQARSAGSQ